MSRAIKFRAWDKESEYYVELSNGIGDGLIGVATVGPRILYLENGETNIGYVGDYVIEQYTGLNDKNGVEIYEGDIVKGVWVGANGRTTSVVKYLDAAFRVLDKVDFPTHENGVWIVLADLEKLEVIGNVHENPELLEGEK